MRHLASILGLCVVASPSLASAHLKLLAPTPRYVDDSRKEGPCGNDPRGLNVTVLPPGARLRVEWEETIPHPSHYRISFDPFGENGLADPPTMQAYYSNDTVLLDAIENTGGVMTADVDLPDVECESCTLQVIQVMYDKQPYTTPGDDIYYTCADIVLRRGAPCLAEQGCIGVELADGGVAESGDAGVDVPTPVFDAGADEGPSNSPGSSGGTGFYPGAPTTSNGMPAAAAESGGCSASPVRARESVRSLFFVALALGSFMRLRRSRDRQD